jgi:hypothetical protein
MSRNILIALALSLFTAGCVAPLPPTPEDIAAKRFDAVPGKSVVYVVRENPDLSGNLTVAPITLDEQMIGASYPGTYWRLEVTPGRHKLAGYASDPGWFVFDTAPGQVYFIQQTVAGNVRFRQSSFRPIDTNYGRAIVMRSELIASR